MIIHIRERYQPTWAMEPSCRPCFADLRLSSLRLYHVHSGCAEQHLRNLQPGTRPIRKFSSSKELPPSWGYYGAARLTAGRRTAMWAEKLDTTGKTWHLREKSVISSWEHHPITGGSSSVDENRSFHPCCSCCSVYLGFGCYAPMLVCASASWLQSKLYISLYFVDHLFTFHIPMHINVCIYNYIYIHMRI